MDLSNTLRRLRRSIASLAVVAIVASLSVASSVSAFTDVPAGSWYEEYVERLVDDGIIDGKTDANKDKFNPGSKLNRAEAAKIIVMAAGVDSEDYVDPATPVFKDLVKGAWYNKYIATAKENGWVSGDDKTGTFRPGDMVSRAEFAKMITGALDLVDEEMDGAPHFSDVKDESAWYYDFVESAYHFQVIDGINGAFKPADAIERSAMAKMTSRAIDGEEREGEVITPAPGVDCKKTPTDPSCVSSAKLTVAAEAYTQKTPVLSASANTVFLKFKLSSSSTVNVTSLNFKRTGASKDSYINAIKVLDAAGKQHGPSVTMGSAGAKIAFASDPILVTADAPAVVTVLVNTTSDATAGSLGIKIESAADVVAEDAKKAAVTAAGTFPIQGTEAALTSSTGLLGTLTVDVINGYTANLDVGSKEQTVTILKLASTANEAVNISRIHVTQNGSAADSDTANWVLKDDAGKQWGQTIVAPVNKALEFKFTESLKLTQGSSVNLTLRADIVGGSSRTVQAVVQNDYDVDAVGVQTGFGILASADAGGTDTSFPIGTDHNSHTISSGSLALSKAIASPQTKIARGVLTDAGIFELNASGEDMELREIYVGYDGSVSTAGSVVSLGVYGSDNSSLASQETSLAADGTLGSNYSYKKFTLSPYITVKSGNKYMVKVRTNLATANYTTGTTFRTAINGIVYKRITRGDLVTLGSTSVTAAALNASGVAANSLTVSDTSLSSSANSSVAATQFVVGQSNAKLGSWILTAGEAEGVNVSSLTVATGTPNTYGATNTNAFGDGYLTSLTLKRVKSDGSEEQIGQTSAAPTSSSTFNASGLQIIGSDTLVVNLYGSVSSSTTNVSNGDVLQLTLAATGAGSASGGSLTASAQNGQANTVSTTGGTLALTSESTTPASRIIHANEAASDLLYGRLTSTVEDITVTKVTVGVAGGVNQLTSAGVQLYQGATPLGTSKTLSLDSNGANAFVTFDGLSINVPKNDSVTLTIKGKPTNSSTLFGNQYLIAAIEGVEATGAASGTSITPVTAVTTVTSAQAPLVGGVATTAVSTTGFALGDPMIAYSTADGVEPGMITASVSSATSMTIGVQTNMTAAATRATRLAKTITTAASAGTVNQAKVAATVTSSDGFKQGDAVMIYNTTDGATWGMVADAVTASNALTISAELDGGAAVSRVTKLPTLATTACSAGTLLATGAVAATCTSTAGFQVGDPVMAYNETNGVELGMVISIDSSTMKVATKADATAATLRISKLAGAVSTAASAGIPLITGVAVTVTSNTGFEIGDALFVFNATDGVELGIVTAKSGTTSLTIATEANMTVAAARVTKIGSAGAMGRVMLVQGSEPTITNSFVSTTATPNGVQTVGDFAVKADGDRPINVDEINLVKSGSNTPERYVTQFDLFTGSGSSLGPIVASVANTNPSGTTAGGITNADTILNLCSSTSDTAGEIGDISQAEADLIQVGDRFSIRDGTNTNTVTVLSITGSTVAACNSAAPATGKVVTFDSTVSIVASVTVAFDAFTIHFDSSASPAFVSQSIPAGQSLNFTIKANTNSVRSTVAQGAVSFNLQIPGSTSAQDATINGLTWSWSDSKPSQTTFSSLTASDNYPLNMGSLSY